MELLDYFQLVFQVSLVISLIIFIIFGAIRNKGKKIRSLVLMIVSIVLAVFFTIALVFDNIIQSGNVVSFYDSFLYYIFIGVSFVYFLIFLILFINNRNFIAAKTIKKKMVYTYHTKEEYLYVFYRYANYIYLVKDAYAGIKYKLRKMEFTDDAIRNINKSVDLNFDFEADRSGMITIKGEKIDQVYYCYKIDLESRLNNDMFDEYDLKDLTSLQMQDFDRFVIYTSLMKSDFNEEY